MERLLQALLAAPIANIFIVSGLIFLGIAVVGDVKDRITPGRSGRIAAGLIGGVLLIAGLVIGIPRKVDTFNRAGPINESQKESPSGSALSPTSVALPNSPSVRENGFVSLRPSSDRNAVNIDDWQSVGDGIGDLQVDQSGLLTEKGAKLALIEDSPEATYARCSQIQDWQQRVDFSMLHVGIQLCARSKLGRYAMLQVTDLPEARDPEFIFFGRVWELTG